MNNVFIKELKSHSLTRVQLLYGNENKGYYGYKGDSLFFVLCNRINYGINNYIQQSTLKC